MLPKKSQLAFLDWEFGIFFHFGIRSFFLGSEDWDEKPMPASSFCPDALDCDSWIRTAKEAGARYAILTCKHHDGFANWPTRFSDYSVASSPFRAGKGDVVREFTDACRRGGLKVGLYYSPAQWGGETACWSGREPSERDARYDDYFVGQITELLTGYGRIDYLWFDACGSGNHRYDRERIVSVIRSLQPDILLFNMWDPDVRWVGNEDGIATTPNSIIAEETDQERFLPRFLPAECDCKLRSTWFDCADNENTLKSLDELIGMYEYSVGRGSNLLLNVGPNRSGLLNPSDAARLREFGEALKKRYETPLPFVRKEKALVYSGPATCERKGCLVDTVILGEDLSGGEGSVSYRLFARASGSSFPVCLLRGDRIGHKAILHFPPILTDRLWVEIEEQRAPVVLTDFRAFRLS